MRTVKWVVAIFLTITAFSNTFAQADIGNDNLKSFIVKKRIELQNDQMNLIKLQDKLKNLYTQKASINALNVPGFAGAISLGGLTYGSLMVTAGMFGSSSVFYYDAIQYSARAIKFINGSIKVAGIMIATGAVIYIGNEAFLALNQSQIDGIYSKLKVIENSIAERTASLAAIEAKLPN